MRRVWTNPVAILIALILIGAGSTLVVFSRWQTTSGRRSLPVPSSTRMIQRQVRFANVSFASWALLDWRTGAMTGSSTMADLGDTMSLVKAWIAADFLRVQRSIPDRAVLHRLSVMIRDSDNEIATEFHHLNGEQLSIDRMISICRLTESHAGNKTYRWSDTAMSARDVARLGGCLADGRGAGPWTPWLLTQMRGVRGDGDFGPRKAFPAEVAAQIAIKNGWFDRPEDGQWHFACLAVSDRWSLGVLLRYPEKLGDDHGRELCQSVAAQLGDVLS